MILIEDHNEGWQWDHRGVWFGRRGGDWWPSYPGQWDLQSSLPEIP